MRLLVYMLLGVLSAEGPSFRVTWGGAGRGRGGTLDLDDLGSKPVLMLVSCTALGNYLVSLCLSFLTCEMRIMALLSSLDDTDCIIF